MNTRSVFVALAATASLALAGCSSKPRPSFTSDMAPGAPLASYQTYAWAFDSAPSGLANPLTFQTVHDQLDSHLRARGFTPASEDEADMIIAFTLGSRDRVDVTDWGPVAPYYPGYGRAYGYGWAYSYSNVDVRTVTEGSMAFDVFDGETKRPVWHGVGSARIGSAGASDELIAAATAGMIDKFMEARAGGSAD